MNDPVLYVGILIGVLVLAGIAVLLLSYSQTKKFRVVNVKARPDGISQTPKKICLISDLHFPLFNVNQNDVIDRIVATKTDVIMIAGDLSHSKKGEEPMLKFISALSSKTDTPILVVMGNHDVCSRRKTRPATEIKKYVDAIGKTGDNVKVLDNEAYILKIQGTNSKMVVAGITDFRHVSKLTAVNVYNEALDAADENDTLVVLEHNPDILTYLDEEFKKSGRDNVVLSGHTHGGQFRLPFGIEFSVLRHDILPKKGYTYGLYDWDDKTKLFISCGLG